MNDIVVVDPIIAAHELFDDLLDVFEEMGCLIVADGTCGVCGFEYAWVKGHDTECWAGKFFGVFDRLRKMLGVVDD